MANNTLSENITRTINDFDDIKAAIIEKGVSVPASMPTNKYGNKIRQIEGAAPTPKDIYAITRPADWLTMPEVTENEIYLLVHLKAPAENLVSFTVRCSGDFTVEYGTVAGNMFVPTDSKTIRSAYAFAEAFLYDDWSDETSAGNRQVMLRVTGEAITEFYSLVFPDRNYSTFMAWNIVDIRANLPFCTSFALGATSTANPTRALQFLRYFSLEGTNNISNLNYMFAYCRSLLAVLALDTSKAISAQSTFRYCGSLISLPEDCDFSKVADAAYMFSNSASIADLSMYRFDSLVDATNMFSYCFSLRRIPVLNSNTITTVSSMLYEAYAIESIVIDLTNTNIASNMFTNNYNLSEILLIGVGSSSPTSFSLRYSSMTETSLAAFFQTLPTITNGSVITITYTPAAISANIEAVKTIATDKGWVV